MSAGEDVKPQRADLAKPVMRRLARAVKYEATEPAHWWDFIAKVLLFLSTAEGLAALLLPVAGVMVLLRWHRSRAILLGAVRSSSRRPSARPRPR